MKTRLFISSTQDKALDGWPMGFCSGCSAIDNKDYSVTTNNLKGDEVPEDCQDAKTFTELMAGLLNAYYNSVDVSNMESSEILRMGQSEEKLGIPNAENPSLPF